MERLSLGHVIAEWWIEAAGGVSVSEEQRKTESSAYSMEQLLVWDPDVLLVQTEMTRNWLTAVQIQPFEAVKTRKYMPLLLWDMCGPIGLWSNL